jgi:hypothetical protein
MMARPYDDSAAAAASELHRLVRRLRGLTARAWASSGRRETVRQLAAEMAGLTAPGRPLPPVPDHALGDVIAVLGQDALEGGDPALVERVAALVADALAATR